MKRLIADDRGVAMLMVIAFMGLAVPLITGALTLAGTLSKDSAVKTEMLKRQYCALGGDEFGKYAISEGLPDGAYPVPCSGQVATVTLSGLPDILSPPPSGDNQRRFQTSKVVTPTTASASTFTTFTYTITVANRDDDSENLNKIDDILPVGFTYASWTTTGVTTSEPSTCIGSLCDPVLPDDVQQLTWTSLGLSLDPTDVRTLTFQASATLDEGVYCNEAWATAGGRKTSTRLTAPIIVGAPGNSLCPGEAITLTSSVELEPGLFMGSDILNVVYTINIENSGTDPMTLDKFENMLSDGFTYVPNTISGTLTTSEPSTQLSGRFMKWNFSPTVSIASGETKTLIFEAQGVFAGGHWNEASLKFTTFEWISTWPSAGIEVIDVRDSTSLTATGSTVYAVYYQLATDTFLLWEWVIYN